ncbi:MAG TPA: hypothetical protein VND93_18195 [Myxococcales bacterium]|nr:hypothetical protein [Myxococcales bacterium]
MDHIVEWDGEHIPTKLRALPPGRYQIVPLDQAVVLTAEEEAGLEEALASLDAGQEGMTPEQVRDGLRAALKR